MTLLQGSAPAGATIRAVSDDAAQRNLGLLVRLRWIAIIGQACAILFTHIVMAVDLPVEQMLAIIGCLLLINLFATWRLHRGRMVTDLTVTVELLIDVTALTALLYLSGGASNPFVTLFILQVILGVMLLSPRMALLILVTSIIAHYWLLGNGVPLSLPHRHDGEPNFLNVHLQGMFLSYVLAAALLFWFVIGIRANLIERDKQITKLRESKLEDDHFVRLGLLSTGAAHELGTPLTTLSVTLDDWAELGLPEPENARQEIARMQTELQRCRRIVSDLLMSTGQERLDAAVPAQIGTFIAQIVEDWRREGGHLTINPGEWNADLVLTDPMLAQSVRNILDNSQQAGAENVEVSCRSEGEQIVVSFQDDGPGFPAEILRIPHLPASTESNAVNGLGLYLCAQSLRRLGGNMCLKNHPNGGALVIFSLPKLAMEEHH